MTEVLLVVEQLRRRVPGGIGRCASGLCEGLRTLDLDTRVTLLASRPPPRRPDPLAEWGFPVRASRLPGPMLTRLWDFQLLSAPRRFPIVHAVSLATPAVHRTASLVVTVHDTAWRHLPETATSRGRRWHEAALGRAVKHADLLIVPSQTVADELAASGVSTDRLAPVAWGADHLPPPDRAASAALLRGLGVRGDYLLSVGTLEPRKNLRRLVEAYRRAKRDLPEPWPLVVVGPRGWGDDGLDDGHHDVVVTGAVEDAVLAGLYASARTFLYVPLVEGYGLPPLEAMVHGTPVVVAETVPSSEQASLRVDPLSVDAIAEGIVAAASDGSSRDESIATGTALVRNRTWENTALRHLELWRSLA